MRLDTLPAQNKYELLRAVEETKKRLIDRGRQDLTFYVCNGVSRVLRSEFGYYDTDFWKWAKQWMDENLITPELLEVLGGCDAQACIDDAERDSGILAYHPAFHVTGRDSVSHAWAYEARLKMLNAALAELGSEEGY